MARQLAASTALRETFNRRAQSWIDALMAVLADGSATFGCSASQDTAVAFALLPVDGHEIADCAVAHDPLVVLAMCVLQDGWCSLMLRGGTPHFRRHRAPVQ
jgi:hypothetical protein